MRRQPETAALIFLALAAACGASAVSRAAANTPAAAPADEPVPADVVRQDGGPAGAALAPLIGRAPVLVAYWRARDEFSEQALARAASFITTSAPGVTLLPVAVLAAGQPAADVAGRLQALGIFGAPVIDDGRLGTQLGVQRVPSFVLLDRRGVPRLIGGADVTQLGLGGATIGDALVAASRGAAVPTLGELRSPRAMRLLGRGLPSFTAATQAGAAQASQGLVKPGRRTLLVYWAASCAHCREALPLLARWHRTKRPADVDVVDIARSEVPLLRTGAADLTRDLPWLHLYDDDKNVMKALEVQETPTALVIGPDGKVLAVQTGGLVDWDRMVAAPTKAAAPVSTGGKGRRPGERKK